MAAATTAAGGKSLLRSDASRIHRWISSIFLEKALGVQAWLLSAARHATGRLSRSYEPGAASSYVLTDPLFWPPQIEVVVERSCSTELQLQHRTTCAASRGDA